MSIIIQVGAGSGGMCIIDLIARDPRITKYVIIEPDVYKEHNAARHYFGPQHAGKKKTELVHDWLKEHRPDVEVASIDSDLMDAARQEEIEGAVTKADLGVCAVDNEAAKFHWDGLMRRFSKPWTLGEVLSGGIGGFIHIFKPNGPCYGCVAAHLQRNVEVEKAAMPDYSQSESAMRETTIPASKASIHSIAALHATATLAQLGGEDIIGFTSALVSLSRVQDVFANMFEVRRMNIPKREDCLFCRSEDTSPDGPISDADVDRAISRINDA